MKNFSYVAYQPTLSRLHTAITAVFAACMATSAVAQTSEVSQNLDNNETALLPTTTLETVVVTAQKMGRSTQDTVGSVSVVTEEALNDNPVFNDYTDVLQNTANVSINDGYNFSIRGISRIGATRGASGADTYSIIVDGVPQTLHGSTENAQSTWDLQQVEVLRGAQSTTIGQNALAGAVIVKSKDPQFTPAGEVQLGYGTANTYQIAGVTTGPITDDLAYRVSVERKHSDGFMTNDTFNEEDWNNHTTSKIRGKLLYFIDDDSEAQLTLTHTDMNQQGDDYSVVKDDYINNDNDRSENDTKINDISLQYSHILNDDWSLNMTTGYSHAKYDRISDYDGDAGSAQWNNKRKSYNLSQEALFNYDNEDKLKAVVGLYAATGEYENHLLANDIAFSLQGTTVTVNYNADNGDGYDNYAAFFNADYQLNPKLTLLTGLRFDYDKRSEYNIPSNARLAQSTGSPAIDQQVNGFLSQANGEASGEHANKVWLPKLGINYAWDDTLKTGLLYQRGYRSGGASTNPIKRSVKKFDPEFTDNFEMSARKQSNDGKLTLSSNIFYTNWKDQQVAVKEGILPYDQYTTNAGKSHLYGLEIEGAYKISPEWQLTAGLGTVKTEFDEFDDNGTDYSGKEFTGARRLTANLGATYRNTAGWFVGGFLNHQGKAWADLANTQELEDYTLVNLKAGYEADNWAVYAHANNAFDERYIIDSYESSSANSNQYDLGDPRTIGMTVNYKW